MDAGGGTGAVLIASRTVAETGSTNADMLALARAGADEGGWLRAERQTSGRGRLGREWVSPVGNLYASTLVRLRPTDPQASTLTFVAAVALHEAVALYLPSPAAAFGLSPSPDGDGSVGWTAPGAVKAMRGSAPTQDLARSAPPVVKGDGLHLKWPNDLLVDGSKISGILLERADDAVVIGIGVNLAHSPELGDRATTNLARHGASVCPARFLDTLAEIFAHWLGRWRSEGLDPVRRRWLDRAHQIGTALTARLPDGRAIDGLFDGLDPDGGLILRLACGERRVIHAADVFLL